MARIPVKYRLTPFGRTVMSLAAEHGMASRAELLRKLEEEGYDFRSERVAHWLYGRNQVDKSFPLALVKALGLTEDERNKLAISFMVGQDHEN